MKKYRTYILCIMSGLLVSMWLYPDIWILDRYLAPGKDILMPPGNFIFGTDELGRSVYARIINGLGGSLKVGILTALFTFVIGIIPGITGGYYSGKTLRIGIVSVLVVIKSLFLFVYSIQLLNTGIHMVQTPAILLMFLSLLLLILLPLTGKLTGKTAGVQVNPDGMISFFTAVLSALPKFVLIIALAALFKPGLILLCFLMAIILAPGFIRIVRSEILSIRNTPYVEAAKSLGYSTFRIFVFHIVPQATPVLIVQIILQVQVAILSESALSFLGVGLPYETLTLGKLINSAREYPSCTWMTFFPVITLCSVILILRNFIEKFSDKTSNPL